MKKIIETFRELRRQETIVAISSNSFSNSIYVFINKILEIFRELWRRDISIDSNSDSFSNNINNKYSKVTSSANIQLEDKLRQFIINLQIKLNHPWQWSIGVYVLALTILWNYPLNTLLPSMESLDSLTSWNQIEVWRIFIGDNWHLINELPVIVIAVFIGLMLWRMFVTSWYILKLVNEFQIEPKLGHPDTAGGLSPLGNLCLLSFIITNVPFIHLSGWLLLGTLKEFKSPVDGLQNYYIYAFLLLLIGLSLIPFLICFFIPVWNVHQRMIEWRSCKQERLYQVGKRINELESRLLNEMENFDLKQLESTQTELDKLKQVYVRNEKLPTWPFNMEIMWRLLISYIIPVLGLISITFIDSIVLDGLINVDGLISYTPVLGLISQLVSLVKINNKV